MFIDNQVTRYENGVTNRPVSDIFNSLKTMDPTRYHQYFEDFDYYTAADWTVTEIGAGGTQALIDGDGGILRITTDALDDDAVAMQKVGESFLLEVGKKAFFKSRLRVAKPLESDFLIGLQVTDTTPFDATDGIYFQKDDGDANVDIICRQNATTGSITAVVTTVEANTFLELAWFYDGVDRLYYGYNGVVVGYLTVTSATFLPDTELTVSFSFRNGEAGATTMDVDYIFAAKER